MKNIKLLLAVTILMSSTDHYAKGWQPKNPLKKNQAIKVGSAYRTEYNLPAKVPKIVEGDKVEVQSWKSIRRSAKKSLKPGKGIQNAANAVAKGIGVNKGEVGYPCAKNSSCNTKNCASGLCQKKFDVGGPCQKGAQCQSGKCNAGSCKAQCLSNGQPCSKNSDCCKGGCWNSQCDKSA